MALRDLWKRDWRATLRRVWEEMLLDDCFGAAAQLAYYFLLAFFPFMMFLIALLGFLPVSATLEREITNGLRQVIPPASWDFVEGTVRDVTGVLRRSNGQVLAFSILGALLVASNGIRAVMVTLNRAYSVREGRRFWTRYLLSVGLTVALGATVVAGALLLALSDRLSDRIAAWLTVSWNAQAAHVVASVWHLASQFLGFAALIYTLELLYHLAPNVRRPWHWITPGSLVGVVLWFGGSKMLAMYVARFGRYEVMYAGLGTVVVFLLWLYIAGLAILVGGELNAELERSSGLLARPAVPAPATVDAAGHDTAKVHRETAPDAAASVAAASRAAGAGAAEAPAARDEGDGT